MSRRGTPSATGAHLASCWLAGVMPEDACTSIGTSKDMKQLLILVRSYYMELDALSIEAALTGSLDWQRGSARG
jgi:hypothetical protein